MAEDPFDDGIHNLFISFIASGFSEMQALQLCALIVVYMGQINPGMPEAGDDNAS